MNRILSNIVKVKDSWTNVTILTNGFVEEIFTLLASNLTFASPLIVNYYIIIQHHNHTEV
jgi:hypothetical protein